MIRLARRIAGFFKLKNVNWRDKYGKNAHIRKNDIEMSKSNEVNEPMIAYFSLEITAAHMRYPTYR